MRIQKPVQLNIVILLAVLSALTVLLAGCGKNTDHGRPSGQVTEAVTPVLTPGQQGDGKQGNTASGSAAVTGQTEPSREGAEESADAGKVSPTAVPTGVHEQGAEETTGRDAAGTEEGGRNTGTAENPDMGSEALDDEDSDADQEPVRDVSADTPFSAEQLKEAWELTFLKWIPEFDCGVFTGTTSSGTYDFAVFQDVSTEEVLEYVKKLEKAGFTSNPELTSGKNRVSYRAFNSQDWCVRIKYRNGSVEIGSGYDTDDRTSEAELEELWLQGMPDELPRFDGGRPAYSDITDSETVVCCDGVTYEAAAAYRDSLSAAGYVLNADEGEQTGFMWYIADNENGYRIELVWSDSIMRLRCGFLG